MPWAAFPKCAVYTAGGSQATSKWRSEPRSVSPCERADLKYIPASFEMGCRGLPQFSLLQGVSAEELAAGIQLSVTSCDVGHAVCSA